LIEFKVLLSIDKQIISEKQENEMALVRERDGKRLHVKSRLMGESLVSKSFIEELKIAPQQRLFPDVNILKIGGQSICDRGAKVLPNIIREIVKNKEAHKMLITTGGGTRSRHIYTIGLELGMPTGIIAKFGSSVSEQNALLITMLLSPWGGIKIGHDEIVKLPTYFSQGCIPVMHGMPPYDYFAIPPEQGRIPIHRTDVGTLILADLIGARSCIFIKDEDGLYTDDPKKNPNAELIPKIGAKNLAEMNQDDLIIERPCLEIIQNSEVIHQIQIINGMEEGNITKALEGEPVGTIIYKE
jgi:molybdenum storage protein